MISNTVSHFFGAVQSQTSHLASMSRNDLTSLAHKISWVAWEVFKVAIAIKFNPYFALCSFAIALLFPEEAKQKLERIASVFEANKPYSIIALLGSAVLFLPVTCLGLSCFIGGQLGYRLMAAGQPIESYD